MKNLERIYSKSERIVARARFSGWTFLREVVIAAILGGIVAVLWIYGGAIEKALNPSYTGEPAYLTESILKWVLLGCGLFVLLLLVLHGLSFFRRELIVTEDKFVYKTGIVNIKSVMLPLNEIKYVDVSQNALQVLMGYGKIKVITEGEAPFVLVVKNLVRPEKFARRLLQQCSIVREFAGRPKLCLNIAPAKPKK